MARTGSNDVGDPLEPTFLRHVGPATAAIIKQGTFDAADIAAGRVSHRRLVEAGVNPGVAERLRREYGLLWAYRWHPGDVDLARRAAALPEAGPDERQWITASTGAWQDGSSGRSDGPSEPEPPTDELGAEWATWPEMAGEDMASTALPAAFDATTEDSTCPRCGGALARYSLGDRASVHCEACGYAGVPVTHVDEPWREAVDRIVRGEATSRYE